MKFWKQNKGITVSRTKISYLGEHFGATKRSFFSNKEMHLPVHLSQEQSLWSIAPGVLREFQEPMLVSSTYTIFSIWLLPNDWDGVSLCHAHCLSWTAFKCHLKYQPGEGIYGKNKTLSIMSPLKNLASKYLLVELRSEIRLIRTHFLAKKLFQAFCNTTISVFNRLGSVRLPWPLPTWFVCGQ